MQLLRRYRAIIVTVMVLGVVALIAWFIYDASVFRLKGTNPANGSEASSSTQVVEFSFNKTLVDNMVADRIVVLVNGENPIKRVRESVEVVDNKILINLVSLDIDTKYTFSISDIESEEGKTIDKVSLTFMTKYVPFGSLSEEERGQAIADVDSTENREPMLSLAPFETDEYRITYIEQEPTEAAPDGSTPKTSKVIEIHVVLSNADYSDEKKIVSARRERALNYLRSRGVDLRNYTIKYSQDPYLGPIL